MKNKIHDSKSGGSNRLAVALGLSLFFWGGAGRAQARPPVVPPEPPLRIEIPDFHEKTLDCGLKVIFLENGELPLVSAGFYAPGGYRLDPPGKEGLVGMMTNLQRDGGAGKWDAESFDRALEDRATSMSASTDVESFTASFNCLAKDLPDVLDLFAAMLRAPRFDAKRFDTDKANYIDSLNRIEDTPDSLSRVLFYRSLLGGSPYGGCSTPRSAQSVTREDIAGFYQKNYGPRGAVLLLTGKFDEEKVSRRLEELFGGWKGQASLPAYSEAKPMGPAIYFFPKDVTQVFIRFGLPGLQRHEPDFIPLEVANYILGGSGFTSRLMREIRSNRGLAYFVDSVFVPYTQIHGPFEVVGGTRPDAVKEYLTTMFKVLDDFSKEGPTEKELSQAKQSMVEEYAYNFESPFTLAPYKATLDFEGYPADYLATYRDRIRAVTLGQASAASHRILSQKDWVLVICGPAALKKELSEFGKVVEVDDVFAPLSPKP